MEQTIEQADNGHIIHLHKGTLSAPFRRRILDARMAVSKLERWVDALQASGRYSFLRDEALQGSGLSADAAKKALQRLARRGRVAKIKRYFYVTIPLEYSHSGGLPPLWYIEDLMKAMKRPYYVGLLSAAALHGASHHQPQEFQVVTDRFLRPVRAGGIRIRFLTSKRISETPVQDIKTATGSMKASTPEATAVDLVRFSTAAGGLDNVAIVLTDLLALMRPTQLLRAVRASGDVPNAQRLGHILERLGARALSKPIHDWLDRQNRHLVPLRPGRAPAEAEEDHRWQVLLDEPLGIEP